MLDVGKVERAETQIDILIERRARERDEANRLADFWEASERAHREKLQRERQAAWYAYEMDMAELHTHLAAEHERAALKLLEEPRMSRR